jgi:predicted extracellular nuclease
VCGDPFTPIYTIQGAGSSSPLDGVGVSTIGVVTGDFQTSAGLRGFFMQDAAGDGNPATSDGIFVFDGSSPSVDVAVGDEVRVRGTADEFFGLTQITSVDLVLICDTDTVAATSLALPVGSISDFEPLEGMLINIAQTLYASGNFTQGRFEAAHRGRVMVRSRWLTIV